MQTNRIEHEKIADFIDPIIHNTQRASQIIEKIRGFIRPHALEKASTNMVTVIHETLELIKSELHKHKVEIHFSTTATDIRTQGDFIQLSQVLLNIFRNAIEVLKEVDERAIFVRLDQNHEYVHVRIWDTGPGLNAELLEKIGTPFFSTKTDGLGIGLSISRTIIEQHNGQLLISNAEIGGACFDIYLPVLVK